MATALNEFAIESRDREDLGDNDEWLAIIRALAVTTRMAGSCHRCRSSIVPGVGSERWTRFYPDGILLVPHRVEVDHESGTARAHFTCPTCRDSWWFAHSLTTEASS
ncbi:hypothetical protein M1M07_18370 [Rhodococcus sp. HM1]|nr:hypothetical protein [Rhodococcus sp. HM1]